MAIDFTSIFSDLEGKVIDFAKTNVADYVSQATADGKQLLTTLKDDIARWTEELAENKITADDFKDLMLGDKDLVEMTALTQIGLGLARIDQFKEGIFNVIINAIPQLI